MDGINSKIVEWGVAGRPVPGETVSGDLHLVKPLENGVLLAIADGLGHGKPAAQAAKHAMNTVEKHSHKPLVQMLKHCDEELRETRGVVMSLARLNALDNSMEWLGVGNVEGMLARSAPDGTRSDEFLMLFPGVVGAFLPPLRTAEVNVDPGDTLVLATDGIRRGFEDEIIFFKDPGETAQGILARDSLETDDALVLVAIYQGRPR